MHTQQPDPEFLITANHLSKRFQDGDIDVTVLSDIELSIMPGERIAIVGASGSGKSTLLQLLGGLDKPSDGEVILCGSNLNNVSDEVCGGLRNKYLGFIYQFHHLLPEFTALENVAMPLMIRNDSINEIQSQAVTMLERVGLKQRLHHKPGELSGGERQRVAIARALVTHPSVLLADEPTGNLDSKTANYVSGLMMELNEELQTAVVLVTHDMTLAKSMQKVYEITDGMLNIA